ncbi:N-acetylmuramic acid 6-phosphate etherase [Pseudoalteromonas denitrificans]|uniref:N-acetylmuramic acid 6-phosphate etherase n=1 Tax=Pseudoalteromonas denitrificans DSM 6059 TaxID=1123010 RepID=A0A1I1UCN7_9GAMM|nr:N-acetylmuramic acid 6-phosphate etherase [Pseudoalteromonas denitrificans]SFD65730.1 N-acetylmuramic acid 6-phosphate etherase [Pseudoalteromonas denitrificans DSM 6059]
MQNVSKNTQVQLVNSLDSIATEGQNLDTLDIDLLDTLGVITKINNEDQKVADAVKKSLPQIAQAVDQIVLAFKNKARLIYIGAGTSGRMGILDAVECRPTFSVSDDIVIGIIAGGNTAIQSAVEGAEDNKKQGVEDLKGIAITKYDVLVGIAASGRTPYVIAAMEYAKQVGATVVGVTCSPNQGVSEVADIAICAQVGPEALTGSTRMKSGTAQKLILNTLSTASMIRCGKSYKNLMVDVNASNEKLNARAIRIVMQATDCDFDTANKALDTAGTNAKLAILIILTGASVEDAKKMLADNNGFLRKAVSNSCK